MAITPKPLGNLDGIVKHGKVFFVTDWVAGKLLRITKRRVRYRQVTDQALGTRR